MVAREISNRKRGGSEEECGAHNPKVVGSKPTLAILFSPSSQHLGHSDTSDSSQRRWGGRPGKIPPDFMDEVQSASQRRPRHEESSAGLRQRYAPDGHGQRRAFAEISDVKAEIEHDGIVRSQHVVPRERVGIFFSHFWHF